MKLNTPAANLNSPPTIGSFQRMTRSLVRNIRQKKRKAAKKEGYHYPPWKKQRTIKKEQIPVTKKAKGKAIATDAESEDFQLISMTMR